MGKSVEAIDGIAKRTSTSHVFPCECGQACWKKRPRSISTNGLSRLIDNEHCRYLLHKGVIGVLTGLTRMLSRCSCPVACISHLQRKTSVNLSSTHLFASLCIKQYPTELDHLCRVLCDINAMFVTRSGYVDDDVSVKLRRLGSIA